MKAFTAVILVLSTVFLIESTHKKDISNAISWSTLAILSAITLVLSVLVNS